MKSKSSIVILVLITVLSSCFSSKNIKSAIYDEQEMLNERLKMENVTFGRDIITEQDNLIKIVEIIFKERLNYSSLNAFKPFKVELINNEIWYVRGVRDAKDTNMLRSIHILINKNNLKVLNLWVVK